MSIGENDINIDISPNPVKIVVGSLEYIYLNFTNNNPTDTAYNLYVELLIPDGVEVKEYSEDISEKNITSNFNTQIIWYNIKNLGPMSTYNIRIRLESQIKFKNPNNSQQVQFDVPLGGIILDAILDTTPEGTDNPTNQIINKNVTASFIPLSCSIFINSSSKKVLKGAGKSLAEQDPIWKYVYTVNIRNNSIQDTKISNLRFRMNNGIRFLNVFSGTGPQGFEFLYNWGIRSPNGKERDYTELYWSDEVLSKGSLNRISIQVAIWDRYVGENGQQNAGEKIPNNTSMNTIATMTNEFGITEAFNTIKAMDIVIYKSVSSISDTDVGERKTNDIFFKINNYNPIISTSSQEYKITDIIPDGDEYEPNSEFTPSSVTKQSDGSTIIVWEPLKLFPSDGGNIGVTHLIRYTTIIKDKYENNDFIKSGDSFKTKVIISGVLSGTNETVSDTDKNEFKIIKPRAHEVFLGYLYNNGIPKTLQVGAPGDKLKVKIFYNSEGIKAKQANVVIRDFLPNGISNIIEDVTYGGSIAGINKYNEIPFNGIEWGLGDTSGDNTWEVAFNATNEDLNFLGTKINMGKLLGETSNRQYYTKTSISKLNFGQPNLNLSKNVTGPNVNGVKPGEVYKYTIAISNDENPNNNVTEAFEMELTDTIPSGLTYKVGSVNVQSTAIYTNPSIKGQVLSMTINKLSPNESLVITYDVVVDNDVEGGANLINIIELTNPYSQPDKSYRYTGTSLTASVGIKVVDIIKIKKLVSPVSTTIGNIVTYVIQVLVPHSYRIRELEVTDIFPNTNQELIQNSIMKDGIPLIPQPSSTSGKIIFPMIPLIDATDNEVILNYSFQVRIINSTISPNFIDIQKNNVNATYIDDKTGMVGVPVQSSSNLEVMTPKIKIIKTQKNVTHNGIYTDKNVSFIGGDILSYKITLINEGKSMSYNNKVTDTISNYFDIDELSINSSKGNATFVGNNLTWVIGEIAPNEIVVLTFNMNTNKTIPAMENITNKASVEYKPNRDLKIQYGPIESNEVIFSIISIRFNKTSSNITTVVGDKIEYTIDLNISKGTILYNTGIYDYLPEGQRIHGVPLEQINSGPVKQIAVVNNILPSGKEELIFWHSIADKNHTIDATKDAINAKYTIIADVLYNNRLPSSQVQTNEAEFDWNVVQGGPSPQTSKSTVDVVIKRPNVTILKEQKNFTKLGDSGKYSTEDQMADIGDVIYYRITLTSNGEAVAYNISVSDIVRNTLNFDSNIVLPTIGTVTVPSESSGGTIIWNINQLPIDTSVQYEFAVKVNSNAKLGTFFTNMCSMEYNAQVIKEDVFTIKSNEVRTDMYGLRVNKSSTLSAVNLGDSIEYKIDVTIPKGQTIYDLSVLDKLPRQQEYISASWTSTESGDTVSIIGRRLITYEEPIPITAPLTNDKIASYSFKSMVISAAQSSEFQTNVVNVNWSNEPGGKKVNPSEDTLQVQVNKPSLQAIKAQRNVTKGQVDFIAEPLLDVSAGDIIEYKLSISNNGKAIAYEVVSKDILNNLLEFVNQGIEGISISGQEVTWTVDSISPNDTVSVIIRTNVKIGFVVGTNVINRFVTNSKSSIQNPTPLPEIKSNEVGFSFVNPVINKYIVQDNVDKIETSSIVGEKVNYKIVLTIEKGSKAYNVQITDNLPVGQSYIPNTLTSIGGVQFVSPSTLIFPNEGTIDATAGEKTIIYSFQVLIESTTSDTEEKQINISYVDWDIDEVGTKGTRQTSSVSLNVTPISLVINKMQSQNGIDFTTSDQSINLGQKIYYKLDIQNPSTKKLFNININDNLPEEYILQSLENVQGNIDVIFDSLAIGNHIFQVSIPELDAKDSASVIFSAILIPPVIPGKEMINEATVTYSVLEINLQNQYGPIKSNNVVSLFEPENIEFIKTSSVIQAQLGGLITYNFRVVIPKGIIIYNVILEDSLPSQQIYIGEAEKNGVPIELKQEGQNLIFPTENIIDATSSLIEIDYSFIARIVTITNKDIPGEIQKNNAQLTWNTDPSGITTTEINSNTNVIVKNPNVQVAKLQRNVTKGTVFDINNINVYLGDLIEFQLVVQNSGDGIAYNLLTKDILSEKFSFVDIISKDIGEIEFDVNDQSVNWLIEELYPNELVTAIFQVKASGGIPAGGESSNKVTTSFDTNLNPKFSGDSINSPIIFQRYPNIVIEKSTDKTNYMLDETVKYLISIRLPKGTSFYNLQVQDILPIGQVYNNNAKLNHNSIIPDIQGQLIAFPILSTGFATKEDVIYDYEFEAIIKQGNFLSNPEIVQINSASVTWSLDKADTNIIGPISTSDEVNVINAHVTLEKLQKKLNSGNEFTKEIVSVYNSQIIEYKIIINNKGESSIYVPIIEDILSNKLRFLEIKSITKGVANLEPHAAVQGGKLIWRDIDEINIGETIELIYIVEVISNVKQIITNEATLNFRLSKGGEVYDGFISNFVETNILGNIYNFVPDRNSYISDNNALSYGVIGKIGKVGYIIENNSVNIVSYNLSIESIPFSYKLFINNEFIQYVEANTEYNNTPLQLQNLMPQTNKKIYLLYDVPSWFDINQSPIKFSVGINVIGKDKVHSINNIIKLGTITLNTLRNIKEYEQNSNLFIIEYNIIINISKGIKVYDLDVQGYYPPSYIFKDAYKDGVEFKVINENGNSISSRTIPELYKKTSSNVAINLNGRIIYPVILEVDATEKELQIIYSYRVLQYKKTQLSIGELENNRVVLTLRTSKDIEKKSIFESSTIKLENDRELECVYINKIFGKCARHYIYKDIQIPIINEYRVEKIIFKNPKVIEESLSISTSECDTNFSKVKYDFMIPYTIIYQGCGCLSSGQCSLSPQKEIHGILEQRSIEVIIYTSRLEENMYNIISESLAKDIIIDKNNYKFCVCMTIITSSVGKVMNLINNKGKCEFIYCCPNCNIINSSILK